MPSSFHTKTIESILDPVATQVSQLVLLHEAGEDGAAMPSLQSFVEAVKVAVDNLAKVGQAQCVQSKDEVLKMDTPPAIERLLKSSEHLVQSSNMLADDPFSKAGREKLISGARGILGGTSDLLLIFDEAEVRTICRSCQSVRDYLKISEVIQVMPDLVTYVKNLTPGMTNMTRLVSQRAGDLTNNYHAEKLEVCIQDLRGQLPSFLSSIKLVVSTTENGGKGKEAADSNRIYYAKSLASTITEIIKYLQLVSSDHEVQADPMNLLQLRQTHAEMAKNVDAGRKWLDDPNAPADAHEKLQLLQALDAAKEISNYDKDVMQKAKKIENMIERLAELRAAGKGDSPEAKQLTKDIHAALDDLLADIAKAMAAFDEIDDAYNTVVSKMPAAKEWLSDPKAKPGPNTGSDDIKKITDSSRAILNKLPKNKISHKHRKEIMDLCDEIDAMMKQLDDYREKGLGHLPEARQLARQVDEKLGQLNSKLAKALTMHGAPPTLEAKFDKAKRWLDNPTVQDNGVGALSTRGLISEARKIASAIQDKNLQDALLKNASDCERLCDELEELVKRGLGDTPEAKKIADELKTKLDVLKQQIKDGMAEVVAEEFADTTTALKQLSAAANASIDVPDREETYELKARAFESKAAALSRLGKQAVALANFGADEKLELVEMTTKKLDDLTAQVITAGKLVLTQPGNQLAQQHFNALKDEWIENMDKLTEQVDNSMEVASFLKASEIGIRKEHEKCLISMADDKAPAVLNAAGNIARRAQRVIVAGKREVENTDDPEYVAELKEKLHNLRNTLPMMVNATKNYAQNHKSEDAKIGVTKGNEAIIDAVSQIRMTVHARKMEDEMRNMMPEEPPLPEVPDLPEELPPPRPPSPEFPEPPPRPPLPEDEEEEFPEEEEDSQQNEAMMQAARELHDEVRHWESQGNNIIAAAKKMAILMAKMSSLVRGGGKKSELIACAKEIAKASSEVTKLSKEVANKCTDRRIRNDMMKTLDRIPTISTQLRILSTVKAASLGDSAEMTKEEEEAAEQATEMLVHNAQNLMLSVKDTVKYAEAASIRIRTDAGIKMRWVRKSPVV